MNKQKNLLIAGIGLAVLSGCGGSSTDDDASATRLKGTAATGAAIANQTVTAKCADGTGFLNSVVTDAYGEWSGDIGENALPCALKVNSPLLESNLYSFASSFGIVNITPLTNLVVARAASTSPDDWFNRADINISQIQLDAAMSSLTSALNNSDFSLPEGNPITTDFDIGDDWDEVLDDLQAAISNSSGFQSYSSLLVHFLEGNNTLPIYVDSDAEHVGDGGIDYDSDDYTPGYKLDITTYVDNVAPYISTVNDTYKPNSESVFCSAQLYDLVKSESVSSYDWEITDCAFADGAGETRTTATININGITQTTKYHTTYLYTKN
ncbi:hypothetical protein [Oceanospirillum sp.]|uniref:hypothetical protein n=1 Tax=Oceanospirillum sp. TaxID=2021254 RepID=UPI003A8E5F04